MPRTKRETVAGLKDQIARLQLQLTQSLKICDLVEKLNCHLCRFVEQIVTDGYAPKDVELTRKLVRLKADREGLRTG